MPAKIIYCADGIARYEETQKIVVIERLKSVRGLAFPGGKQEPGEYLSATILREFQEETGLRFEVRGVLGVYAEPGRDPRGNYISTVFVGIARGEIRCEPDKTRVLLYDTGDLKRMMQYLMFDHAQMFSDYLERR